MLPVKPLRENNHDYVANSPRRMAQYAYKLQSIVQLSVNNASCPVLIDPETWRRMDRHS